MGIYYIDFSSPPDPTRAARCFQKAFELDARETEAAKRLAHGFAEEREWDLVEVVARRTIEGEGGLDGGLGSAKAIPSANFKPTNAWAWKALGVVELVSDSACRNSHLLINLHFLQNRHNYSAAIQAFQITLRSNEEDALTWLRLGEAYAKAGRHAAAIKALDKSHELCPEDWTCIYQIGDVQRQTGQFAQAINTFSSVLSSNPNETVTLLSLAETQLALGRSELATGFLGRASMSFISAISTSLDLIDSSNGFRRLAWKTIADALLALAGLSIHDNDLSRDILYRIAEIQSDKVDDRIAEFVDRPLFKENDYIDTDLVLKLAVVTCNYRLSLFAKDEDGIGDAWFDLGVSLFRLSFFTSSDEARQSMLGKATEYVRVALLSDPGNPAFWEVFGVLNFVSQPAIAQHAFIRALEMNNKVSLTNT